MHKADVDPDLERQLDTAQADEPVEAVLLLHTDGDQPPAADVEALMQEVSQQDGGAEMNYMPLVGALIVRARSGVIRQLIRQPGVEVASANRLAGDAAI